MRQRKNYLRKLNRTLAEQSFLKDIYKGLQLYSSCHEKHPMDVHRWVFTLHLHFCVWPLSGKNISFFTFNRSVSNSQFFCQIYVCNVTNKRIKKKLEENLYVCTLKLDLLLSDVTRQILKCTQGKLIFSTLYHIDCLSEYLLE